MKIAIEADSVLTTPLTGNYIKVEMDTECPEFVVDAVVNASSYDYIVDYIGRHIEGEQAMIQFLQQNGYIVKGANDE